jgi:sugar/nucleoside kinase (ribokinase family)
MGIGRCPVPIFFWVSREMKGLFVGLVTLDVVYSVAALPQPNQKIVALADAVTAGGPATNAAVTFGYLGNEAVLLGSVGAHPMGQGIVSDLQGRVNFVDLHPDRAQPPPMSSILVTQATGDRAVVSRNAVQSQAAVEAIPGDILLGVDIVLLDGHQMAVGKAVLDSAIAQQSQVPVVLDGGSWKAGLEDVLPHVDYAICSANFYPPGCETSKEVFAYLKAHQISRMAITRGGQPIQYFDQGNVGEIAVPQIRPVDTLGAGDVFHGAFCHAILRSGFQDALAEAAGVAAKSCMFFGTRAWMEPGRGL